MTLDAQALTPSRRRFPRYWSLNMTLARTFGCPAAVSRPCDVGFRKRWPLSEIGLAAGVEPAPTDLV